ncbi:MAG: hypothetical protein JXA49_01155 [Actinobacteria bacterium]|nr:hypothetical protein [Actinomycetota bacterium]
MKLKRIAYFGDDRDAIEDLRETLEKINLQLKDFSPTRAGSLEAVGFNPDLILWDLDNAEVDGGNPPIEMIRESGFENQPILGVAKREDAEKIVKSLASGATDFIYKPVIGNPLPRLVAAMSASQRDKRVNWSNRALDTMNEQVRTILSSLKDPAYIVDPEFNILYMNRAAIEIYGEGIEDGTCYHMFYGRSQPCDVCLKSKGTARWRSILKNGKAYRFMSTVIVNSKGEFEKVAMSTDITPDEEVMKIYKTFISNVSHDLRTPLAAIDQYANIMLEGLAGDLNEDQKKYIEVVKRSSFRLGNLVENLIDANNILSGHFKLKLRVSKIPDILDIVLERLNSQAQEKGLRLQVQIPGDLPSVYVDTQRIAQVIANLAGNSIKFTEEGIVQIRAGYMPRGDGRVIVSVEDSGIGIPSDDLSRVFDMFYRVESDQVFLEEGAGLGLTISREIIRAHGGTLWAESLEGMGSAFHFALPAHKGDKNS